MPSTPPKEASLGVWALWACPLYSYRLPNTWPRRGFSFSPRLGPFWFGVKGNLKLNEFKPVHLDLELKCISGQGSETYLGKAERLEVIGWMII